MRRCPVWCCLWPPATTLGREGHPPKDPRPRPNAGHASTSQRGDGAVWSSAAQGRPRRLRVVRFILHRPDASSQHWRSVSTSHWGRRVKKASAPTPPVAMCGREVHPPAPGPPQPHPKQRASPSHRSDRRRGRSGRSRERLTLRAEIDTVEGRPGVTLPRAWATGLGASVRCRLAPRRWAESTGPPRHRGTARPADRLPWTQAPGTPPQGDGTPAPPKGNPEPKKPRW